VRQAYSLYLCEAAALQEEQEMALIMIAAALKLCCKEAKAEACACTVAQCHSGCEATAVNHPCMRKHGGFRITAAHRILSKQHVVTPRAYFHDATANWRYP